MVFGVIAASSCSGLSLNPVSAVAVAATGVPPAPKAEPAPPPKGEDVLQRPGQLSLFVSRREGKLFVRKGFTPAFDVPITIAQPDKPLGTHLFTAGRAGNQGAGMMTSSPGSSVATSAL